jgi:hypothetical protein
VWKDSIVFKPQACPLARSASVQLIGCHLLDGEVRGPEDVCARVGGEGDVVEPPRACTVLNDHPVAVTTSGDATVRLWDLREHRELDRIDLPTSVRAIGVGAGNAIVAGFGWDLLVLEPTTGRRR